MKTFFFTYTLVLFFCATTSSYAQQLHNFSTAELIERQWIAPEHARIFSKIQVQDFQGRIKPIHTLSLELLRKIYGKSHFSYLDNNNNQQKLTPTQVFLGMHYKPDSWQLIECIKIQNKAIPKLKQYLKINTKGYASVSQFFDFNGTYKIKDLVSTAYRKAPGKRNTFDKGIIKIDERVNILWTIFNGQFLRIFPKKDDPNQKWYSPIEKNVHFPKEDELFFSKFTTTYLSQLETAIKTKDWSKPNETVRIIDAFQLKNGSVNLIPSSKVLWEIWFNDHQIFFFCLLLYTVIGIFLLLLAFLRVFHPNKIAIVRLSKFLTFLIVCVFCYQAFGIGLRWYISEHAPWSNGYEATIFISWITVLAGLVFSKTSAFSTALASILAMCLLGIAHGGLMTPEITNLVPVLKSYWLLIHVAIITGSYGFLALGSLTAFTALILLSIHSFSTNEKVSLAIHNLTQINQLTSTIGLFLLTAGTFLGGIWANESWGRYWGWDPKETWALISIIIYSFVLHIRIIFPKNYIYFYNVCSLFAISSIIMTFFGVNYYLSGLHSYAKGDSFPIPRWVYILATISLLVSICPLLIRSIRKPAAKRITTGYSTQNH